MTELTINQLIKIVLGVLVVVAVVIGVFLFFRGSVIDFFKNLPGEEGEETQDKSDGAESEIGDAEEIQTLSISCEDCKSGIFDFCTEEECSEIAIGLIGSGKTCQFTPKENPLGRNKCVTKDA